MKIKGKVVCVGIVYNHSGEPECKEIICRMKTSFKEIGNTYRFPISFGSMEFGIGDDIEFEVYPTTING